MSLTMGKTAFLLNNLQSVILELWAGERCFKGKAWEIIDFVFDRVNIVSD